MIITTIRKLFHKTRAATCVCHTLTPVTTHERVPYLWSAELVINSPRGRNMLPVSEANFATRQQYHLQDAPDLWQIHGKQSPYLTFSVPENAPSLHSLVSQSSQMYSSPAHSLPSTAWQNHVNQKKLHIIIISGG